MKIKMLSDFRGRETNEQYYQAGQVADLPDDVAARLVADKRAEYAQEPAQEQKQEPKQDKPKGRRK